MTLLAVVAAGAVIAVLADGGAGVATPVRAQVADTAVITRQDLLDTKTVTGALTYSGQRRLTTGAAGTVTSVPAEGSVVRRGRSLLKVDRRPVTLMYGTLPLYRPLRRGVSDGPDVRQLERNLRALGYGKDLTVDDHFSYATYLAVREWQQDPYKATAGELATGLVWVSSDASVDETLAKMEQNQIRRLPVIEDGRIIGMISEADLARHLPDNKLAEFVHRVYASA
ncbi:CBS domain-containing protein [Streptosporangium sp. NPDC001682]